MNQSFEKHFREKPDRKLYDIYTGKILASYEERLLAQRILKEKGFDFDDVSKYLDKWEYEKILDDIEEENRSKILIAGIFNPLSPLFKLLMGILCIALSIFQFLDSTVKNIENSASSGLDFYLNIILPIVFTGIGIGLIVSSRKRRNELEYRRVRIKELNEKFKK